MPGFPRSMRLEVRVLSGVARRGSIIGNRFAAGEVAGDRSPDVRYCRSLLDTPKGSSDCSGPLAVSRFPRGGDLSWHSVSDSGSGAKLRSDFRR